LVEGSYEKAKAILTEHRDKLDAVADALLEQETIEREEILKHSWQVKSCLCRKEKVGRQKR